MRMPHFWDTVYRIRIMIIVTFISRGSEATQLRCGGTSHNQVIVNVPQSVLMKKNYGEVK